jgi:hypothetical protein
MEELVEVGNRSFGLMLEAWKYYGKQATFDLARGDWITAYPDLVELLEESKQFGAEVYPNKSCLDPEDGNPLVFFIKLPVNLQQQFEQRNQKIVRRQITIDGKEVDLRNGRNHMLLTCKLENLQSLLPHWVNMLLHEPDSKTKRSIEMNLERLIAYRGHELPPDVKQSILDALASIDQKVAVTTLGN